MESTRRHLKGKVPVDTELDTEYKVISGEP